MLNKNPRSPSCHPSPKIKIIIATMWPSHILNTINACKHKGMAMRWWRKPRKEFVDFAARNKIMGAEEGNDGTNEDEMMQMQMRNLLPFLCLALRC